MPSPQGHVWLAVLLAIFVYLNEKAAASPSRYLFIFGDSYTTTAFADVNHPLAVVDVPVGDPASHETTSTGGVNWVDIVSADASRCGTTTYNYAVGANTVNASRAHVAGGFKVGGPIKDLRDQEKEFAKNDVLWVSDNTIFIHWFGINDVAIQVWSGRNLNDSEAILRPDIDDYFGLFERQHSLGARSFVTILMPPIHRAPIFNYGFSPEAREVQSLTEYWNEYMQEEREKFLLHYPNTTSIVFDPSPAFNRILDDPHNYGLPQRKAKHGAASLWHDFIHPGIDIQKAVGEEVNNVLQKSWPCGETEDIR